MKSPTIATLLGALASSVHLVCATIYPAQVNVDSRSLDDIYIAAQQESGPLQVAWGGDGEIPASSGHCL